MSKRHDDLAELLFFLIGAEAANQMFEGRTATDALNAAGRLLGYPPEAIDQLRKLVTL